MSTGEPTPYTSGEESALADAVAGALEEEGGEFTTIKVRADVEWSGESRGVRETRLTISDFDAIKGPLERAQRETQRAASTGRSRSYRAKSPIAQVHQLSVTKHGRESLSGIGVTARTMRGWRLGRTPSKANQTRIAEAYEQAANRKANEATARAISARHEFAEAFNRELRDGEGVDIRLRNIESFHVED